MMGWHAPLCNVCEIKVEILHLNLEHRILSQIGTLCRLRYESLLPPPSDLAIRWRAGAPFENGLVS